MIDLSEVGAFPAPAAPGQFSVRFGIYLPGIHSTDNFEVLARVIHSLDRFDPAVPAATYSLAWQTGSALDLWSGTFALTPAAGRHLGQAGVHLYRFELWWTSPGGNRQCVGGRPIRARGGDRAHARLHARPRAGRVRVDRRRLQDAGARRPDRLRV